MLKQNQRKITKILAGISGVLFLGGSLLLGVNASQNKITVDGIKDQTLANKFSTVHFNVGGNDFGGGFFWTEAKALATPQEVSANGERLLCSAQIRGFYYNSQRGERLWPLDTDSQGDLARIQSSYNPSQLTINGGFYTNCQKKQAGKLVPENEDGRTNSLYGIYGRITHTYKGREYSIYAGLLNNLQQNELPTAELRCNFQRIDNQYPFGYIYDKAGGIALVGAYVKSENLAQVNAFHESFTEKLSKTKCVNDFYSLREDPNNPEKTIPKTDDPILGPKDNTLIFGNGNALETMMNLGIRGIVGLSSQVQTSDQKGIENNTQKTSLLVSTTENISNIINIANKRAESLCRNKWGSLTPNGDIICAKNGGSIDPRSYAGKTIVIKEGDLTLTKYMETTSQPITILLIHGDLKLTNTNASQTFLGNGYPDRDGIIKANFLKGNFIINGLIQNQGTEEITNKLIVHGKIASFNTLQEPNDQTKVKLRNIGIDTSKKIGLSEIFTWKCNLKEGIDLNGNPCGQENDGTSKSFLIDKSFGLIDMYFPSKLFK
ncbi:hypothetical protein HXK74_00450 [Candidatus Gracilibacteria bacterium]|nr:hypothetical protein [Candidatus Gracilibacteria bacterium]